MFFVIHSDDCGITGRGETLQTAIQDYCEAIGLDIFDLNPNNLTIIEGREVKRINTDKTIKFTEVV